MQFPPTQKWPQFLGRTELANYRANALLEAQVFQMSPVTWSVTFAVLQKFPSFYQKGPKHHFQEMKMFWQIKKVGTPQCVPND